MSHDKKGIRVLGVITRMNPGQRADFLSDVLEMAYTRCKMLPELGIPYLHVCCTVQGNADAHNELCGKIKVVFTVASMAPHTSQLNPLPPSLTLSIVAQGLESAVAYAEEGTKILKIALEIEQGSSLICISVSYQNQRYSETFDFE